MREGNLARDAKCVVVCFFDLILLILSNLFVSVKKDATLLSVLAVFGIIFQFFKIGSFVFSCQWCNLSVHSTCYRQFRPQCDFGPLRKIVLPPNAVTTPRAELPMDLLLNIHTNTVTLFFK